MFPVGQQEMFELISISATLSVTHSPILSLKFKSCMIKLTDKVIEDTHTLMTPLTWLVTFAKENGAIQILQPSNDAVVGDHVIVLEPFLS
jgi:hypothetical protein